MATAPIREQEQHGRFRPAVIIALVLSLALFAGLADELAEWQPFVSLDRHVDEELNEGATPWVTRVMEDVSWMGGTTGLLLAATAAVGVLVVRRCVRAAALVALSLAGAQALDSLLKVEFARPRPSFAHPVVAQAHGYSFPSGHATASMALYGALAYLAMTSARAGVIRTACSVGALILVGMIGFSRVYLGEHFPSDVIAGWCVALAWLSILVLVLFPGPRERGRGRP